MNDFMIRLSSVDEINQFIRIATLHPCAVELVSGSTTANGKAYMRVFNLDFADPLRVTISGTQEQRDSFREAVSQYIIEA